MIETRPTPIWTSDGLIPAPVYFAGPIDYVEHRSPGAHLTDNWRHRFFSDLGIKLLCPICLNVESVLWADVMRVNREAISSAQFLVAYFGNDPTFGTPIEVWEWTNRSTPLPACLVHPARPGVFVQYLAARGLYVARDFEEARQWLRRQLIER